MKNKILFTLLLLSSFVTYSQVGIGTPTPNSSSQLEVAATNRGVLIPRINLTSSTDVSTIAGGNVNSLLIFNTATISDIKPGYYYWFDNKWNRIVVSGETAVPAGSVIYNSVNQTFSYIDNSGNSQVIDFSPIVKANETITNQIQNTATGAITYTNEAGNSTTSQVVSANTGNLLKAGTDGGAMLDVAAIPVNPTTVSNASTGNIATVTVNGIASTGAPIVNLNETSLSGTSLTTTVNGVSSTALDLSPILASGTTNTLGLVGNTLTSNVNGISSTSNAVSGLSNASTGNTATVTVNGITSTGAPIVNLNETSLTGTSLTTTVNGVASTPLDLSPILASGTTNTLDLAGNILTSNVNGVSSTSDAVSGVSNASTGNTATVTVNGITSTGAPIVNLNETSLSGTILTTTVNGVASTALDLAPAISASQTVTNLVQTASTGVITYTNESGTNQTANVTSTNAGNILTVGTDGGSLFTPASLSDATSVSNSSTVNTATVTVNGKTSTGAPIVNLNETSLSGTSLTTIVNGVSSTALDLSPILASGTTNALSLVGNTLTSNVNGVSSTSNAVSGVSNSSTGNTATVTVNGITSTGAPIVNLNETALSGTSLTTTVNGVSSTALDLAPAISASQTVTNLVQTASNGVITYTNESGANQTANVISTNAGNILTVGTDGGSLFTPTSLADATSVSNSSTGNTATVTVNGKTSTGALIVNLNETSLSGTSLTTSVNGVASTALDLAPAISASQTVTDLVQTASTGVITYTNESGANQTANVTSTNTDNILTVGTDGGSLLTSTSLADATSVSNSSTGNTATVTVNGKTSTGAPIVNSNTLTAANGNLVSTVNGVATTPEVSVLIAANNGLTATNGNVQLDGSLIKPTIIATDATNTLAISGLQPSAATTDLIVVADNTGVLKTKTLASLNANNWNLLGNAGTDPLTNFLGTTDNVPLHFRINNTNAGKITNDTFTTALGYNTLSPTATGVYNTTIGTNTLNKLTSGSYNTVFGVSSAENLTTGSNNTALGINSLQNNISGNYNVGVGANAFQAVNSGNGNVGLGNSVGFLRTGNQNIAIGFSADDLGTTGSNNLVIGVGNNTSSPTVSNEMNIANTLFATSINGAIGTGSVGIAVQAPTATLDVNGNARVRDLPAGLATDDIVTTDADGNLRTITPSVLVPVTTVSNTSSVNALSTTVNGVKGNDVNIINSNTLTAPNGNLVSTVNGVATTPEIPVLIAANNGLTAINGNVQLDGSLIKPTAIATDATNTLAISGLQSSASGTDLIVVADNTGVLKTKTLASLNANNWNLMGNAGTDP
ncbi:beta strand repeat-containing protein [Flavobacterium quisquiliarum]|uniref:S-layer family protein n=1 Tax=Flavobacterium quisquiliarum TaxID=1834436 RepID=A0ABV8W2A9_9FLAO|nr:S-layer family protein [Flavobacterium quisquiliarum]MBW1655403.1 hypothetical protein [Flavobacterium quisquiliarum]NWL03027.1 hypothetical protein [Flavobacterium collinsii]